MVHPKGRAPCLWDCAFSVSWGRTGFSYCPVSGWLTPIKRNGRCVVVRYVQRRLIVAEYCTGHPYRYPRLTHNQGHPSPPIVGMRARGLEPPVLVSCKYLMISPRTASTTPFVLFLGFNNPLAFQEQHKKQARPLTVVEADLWLMSKYHQFWLSQF